MVKSLVAVSSITYAMKAKALLNSQGYYCEIAKTPKNLGTGCGYSIKVRDNVNIIYKELDKAGISHNGYIEIG